MTITELLADTRQRIAEREQTAERLSADAQPVRLVQNSGIQALITPSLVYPDGWRITYVDDAGPISHSECRNKYDALWAALSENYKELTA